jgi:hypothetical protein
LIEISTWGRVNRQRLVLANDSPRLLVGWMSMRIPKYQVEIARSGVTVIRLLCDPLTIHNALKYRTGEKWAANSL